MNIIARAAALRLEDEDKDTADTGGSIAGVSNSFLLGAAISLAAAFKGLNVELLTST